MRMEIFVLVSMITRKKRKEFLTASVYLLLAVLIGIIVLLSVKNASLRHQLHYRYRTCQETPYALLPKIPKVGQNELPYKRIAGK